MFDFGKIFGTDNSGPPVRIKIRRAMRVSPHGEPARHVDLGEEISVSRDTVKLLDRLDYDMIDPGPQQELVEDPSPQRDAPRPLPARWNELPECFSKWWNLTEEFRCAREHIEAIRQTRVQIFGTDYEIGNADVGTVLVGGLAPANGKDAGGGVLSTLRPMNFRDPKLRKIDRFLAASTANATDYLERLRSSKEITLQRAFLECGAHRLKLTDELSQLITELAQIGFEIFATRVKALGLADFQVRRLFNGSSDFEKYASEPMPYAGSLRSAGLDCRGQMIVYSDASPAASAAWSIQMTERMAELAPLLVEGRKELLKARKVSAA